MCRDQTGLLLQKTNTGVYVLVCVKLHSVLPGEGWWYCRKYTGASRSWPGYVRAAPWKQHLEQQSKYSAGRGNLGLLVTVAWAIFYLYLQWLVQYLSSFLKRLNNSDHPLPSCEHLNCLATGLGSFHFFPSWVLAPWISTEVPSEGQWSIISSAWCWGAAWEGGCCGFTPLWGWRGPRHMLVPFHHLRLGMVILFQQVQSEGSILAPRRFCPTLQILTQMLDLIGCPVTRQWCAGDFRLRRSYICIISTWCKKASELLQIHTNRLCHMDVL